jgi:hypothetical protein
MEVNSGTRHDFAAGDVILLENVMAGGHKLWSDSGDMRVLLVTLPQHYHHVGKDKSSLPMMTASNRDPCPNPTDESAVRHFPSGRRPASARKWALGSIGTGLTLLAADFLGKVAPLWLSVGIGGTCFVVGGTYAFVQGGDMLLDQIELLVEKRRLDLLEDEEEEIDETTLPIDQFEPVQT